MRKALCKSSTRIAVGASGPGASGAAGWVVSSPSTDMVAWGPRGSPRASRNVSATFRQLDLPVCPAMVGELMLLLVTHLALTGLPAVAAALFLASRGERRLAVLLAVALAASGIAGLLGFWVYYGSHLAGQTYTYLLAFGSALATAWMLFAGGLDRAVLRRLA